MSDNLAKNLKLCFNRYVMEVYLRISKGWSRPVANRSRETCDACGAKLWIGPGSQIYCDQIHSPEMVETMFPNPAEKPTTIKF